MQLIPIKTQIIKNKDNLIEILLKNIKKQKIKIEDNDILVISSKVVALSQGRIVNFKKIKVSKEAKQLAKKYFLEEGFCELVLREADKILGGVYRAILTLKENILIANAGVDHSNAPTNYAILLPKNLQRTVNKIRKEIENKTKKKIAVIICDSRCQPLRLGSVGIALAVSGTQLVEDIRGKKDLFGNEILITRKANADNLCCASLVLMGETDERVPFVLIKNSGIRLSNKKINAFISPRECLFSGIYSNNFKKDNFYTL